MSLSTSNGCVEAYKASHCQRLTSVATYLVRSLGLLRSPLFTEDPHATDDHSIRVTSGFFGRGDLPDRVVEVRQLVHDGILDEVFPQGLPCAFVEVAFLKVWVEHDVPPSPIHMRDVNLCLMRRMHGIRHVELAIEVSGLIESDASIETRIRKCCSRHRDVTFRDAWFIVICRAYP